MKTLKNYIKEGYTPTFFDSWDYTNYYVKYHVANNFLRYVDGDKTFGELVAGDTIYYYSAELDDIIELTVKGKIRRKGEKMVMSVEPFSEGHRKQNVIDFGPAYSSWSGNTGEQVDEYNGDNIPNSSLCISIGWNAVFGTNLESVKKIAHSSVTKAIEKAREDMNKLKAELERLEKKLNSFV